MKMFADRIAASNRMEAKSIHQERPAFVKKVQRCSLGVGLHCFSKTGASQIDELRIIWCSFDLL